MPAADQPNPPRRRCPICARPVGVEDAEFPFCSRRCRVQDLANWADERYVIHTPLHDPEAQSEDPAEPGETTEKRDRGKPAS